MKRNILSLIMCVAVFMTLMTGCGAKSADTNSTNDSIITITMSDESKKYEEEVVKQDGVKAMLSEEYFDQVMATLLERGEQTFPECTVENILDSEEWDGSKVYTLTNDDYETIVLYIHGGAWSFGISEEHVTFCDALATKLNAKVYMPLYPLAPQATSEETYAVIESFYKEILKEGKDIYIMGDSAGGNIALGLMYTIKAEGLEEPEKMVLIAPCSDMTMSNEAMTEIDETDPELSLYGCKKCAELWAGENNLKDPKYSAIYADVSGYPDTMIFQGTNDILYPDNMILYEKLKEAGVDVTLVKGEGFWHVFPTYSIPEQETALNLIEEFCGK